MPAFLRSSQLSFCGAHSNPRHSPLPRLHSTPESKLPKEGRGTKKTVLLPHPESNGVAPPLLTLPRRDEARGQRLGSCLAPWGCFRGWARAGQRVKPPQYPNLEIRSLLSPPVLGSILPRFFLPPGGRGLQRPPPPAPHSPRLGTWCGPAPLRPHPAHLRRAVGAPSRLGARRPEPAGSPVRRGQTALPLAPPRHQCPAGRPLLRAPLSDARDPGFWGPR